MNDFAVAMTALVLITLINAISDHYATKNKEASK